MKYQMHKDIMKHEQRRAAFNRLAKATFQLSFEEWYQSGYWSERNQPYVLFDGERAIANISVNQMEVLWEGKTRQVIQLGTVMTDKEYRNQGLSRMLMEVILEEWQDRCEAVILFANKSVLDFYPRFGFRRYDQYRYSMPFEGTQGDAVKLDMDGEADRAILQSCYQKGNPFSRIQEINNFGLLMFYCMAPMKDSVFYSESSRACVIAEQQGSELHCYNIFGEQSGNQEDGLKQILTAVAAAGTERVIFHFTPAGGDHYSVAEVGAADTLFICSDTATMFTDHKLLFPEMSHT